MMLSSAFLALLLLPGPSSLQPGSAPSTGPGTPGVDSPQVGREFSARQEVVVDFASFLEGLPQRREGDERIPVVLERITTAVPWPRGLAVVDGELIVLARGRHRNAGGIDPEVEDRSGTLFAVDPRVSEPVVIGRPAGKSVRANARPFAMPATSPFHLYDPAAGAPIEDTRMDRPYCTLAFDSSSQNFFICGYSGVDLPGGRFRKNATDSIHRFDLRDGGWHPVEQHDPSGVDGEELGYVVSNEHYPHHDPRANPAPHGLLNGPNGAEVVGGFLYAVGKDNHILAQYDLADLRRDPSAGPPASRVVLGDEVELALDGERRTVQLLGHSALAAYGGHLYVGFRTSSVVVRFPLDDRGDLVEPVVGELIAVFEPWSTETGRSANLIDLDFNAAGELFVSCASRGRVWKVGIPDPGAVFDGIDVGAEPTVERPYLDLVELTGNPKARTGNIVFDDLDRLYVCSGNYDSGTDLAGVIYRAH